jgi:uncharacterized membrane protein
LNSREKDLQGWQEAGLIDAETQARIAAYLRDKDKQYTPPLFALFAVIGALLTGGGISLLLAHNWDRLPHAAQLAVAIFLLPRGQALVIFTLRKKTDSAAWRESSAILHYFSLGFARTVKAGWEKPAGGDYLISNNPDFRYWEQLCTSAAALQFRPLVYE